MASFDDFAPQEKVLRADAPLHLQPGGGRSSNNVLPFFNVGNSGGGVVIAVGWSGEWAADFTRGSSGVRAKAGLAHTHLVLHPGETIRTPRILLLFYSPDRWCGQNLLRQFILSHHRPKQNGQPLAAPITWGNWGGTRAEVHLDNIEKLIRYKLPIDYYWIDADWYANDWGESAAYWDVRKDLYPGGMKQLSDVLERSGRHLMLWIEPERAFQGSFQGTERRKWLLKLGHNSNLLLNLGDPDARRLVTDVISQRVESFGLGCYRQDFNMDPLPYWRAHDAEDRQGITEIRHIEGLYAFWDELLERHPAP